jgi:DNA-binding response OmpR family regulator
LLKSKRRTYLKDPDKRGFLRLEFQCGEWAAIAGSGGSAMVQEKVKVLIIEDDWQAAGQIADYLSEFGFAVDHTDTVTQGISNIKHGEYDVVLLDLNLPDYDGYELLKTMRHHAPIPIIVISAYSDTSYKVRAFRFGASDYMTKPLDLEELEARIWTVLGRVNRVGERLAKGAGSDDMALRIEEFRLWHNGLSERLTGAEERLLALLLERQGSVVRRNELLEALQTNGSERSLDYHIKNIRKKLEKVGVPGKTLQTVYGMGYQMLPL